jgi:hypothetical protein
VELRIPRVQPDPIKLHIKDMSPTLKWHNHTFTVCSNIKSSTRSYLSSK